MIYKEFQDLKLSSLGFGAMRLPTLGDQPDAAIDEERTAGMIARAIENGVNYFDTAYGYHNGQSEVVMGKLLRKYPRDSYCLASKFPGYDLSNMNKVEEIFEEQLKKCGVEYFDFYLLHNVYEKNIDAYLNPEYGILEYLLQQKKAGRIRHLGFSAHARYETLEHFLKACGEHMEFCQIQLNYLDWKLQDAKSQGRAFKCVSYACLGHGTFKRRTSGTAFRGKYRKAENASSGGRNSGMGFPLPSERTWCDCGFIRNVEHGADGEKYLHL